MQMHPTAKMVDSSDLPVEVCEIIFRHLPLDGLRNAALASRSFRWMAQPYLFQSFTLIANNDRDAMLHFLKTGQRIGLVDTIQRYDFYTSPRIASFVQTCKIEFVTWPDHDFEPVFDSLCAHLTDFSELEELSLANVVITPQHARDIAQCRRLKCLSLTACVTVKLATSDLQRKWSTQSLHVRCVEDPRLRPPQHWLSIININTLSTLHLDSKWSSLDALEEITKIQELTALKSITLQGDEQVVKSELLPLALSKCPSLMELRILPSSRGPHALTILPPPESVPLLAYDGPHYLLKPILKEQRQLRHIRVMGDRWGGTCDMFDLQQDLPMLQTCAPDLQSMQLRAFPTKALCGSIASLFPRLRSLSFILPLQTQAQEPMYALTKEPFCRALLNMLLSPGLQHLVIISMIGSDSIEGREVIDTLTEKYPALRNVYLHFPDDYWMTWVESPRLNGQGTHRGFLSSGYLNVRYDWF
ncbi:uncharacterized protein BT62DRAFT_138456 [Guyanagaster necrorhizus]|uniref:F-box domain-containing protein n=1 Tax=Guyanagaster necrorhizus TaxID=856835 RepID=A0A9P8AS28_9AGAR|nr:uncharacterized protein BT62DRAFT_138456 [Guyanagaster necrorhizus MCA 3950]KAG7445849.1 hypothetical protein BT62DRAFT_138456 [Guyanagaster necrorhizus MCA 3950]